MSERVTYTGKLVKETELARLLRSMAGRQQWFPKSVFSYWSNDGSGNVKFRLDGFTNGQKAQAALFDEQ